MDRGALRFSRSLALSDIFVTSGDYINIFVHTQFLTPDYPGLSEQLVFGCRPYSAASDLVAIICHMGIIYPSDRSKKSARTVLYTAPSALKPGAPECASDDARRIDDDFKFHGVVVTVVAAPPLDAYPAAPGFGVQSQLMDGGGAFSIDVVDFHFVTDFEPEPRLADDAAACRMHSDNLREFVLADDPEDEPSFVYSPDFFDGQPLGSLFREFVVTFVVDQEHFVVRADSARVAVVRQWTSDGTRDSQEVVSAAPVRSVRFGAIRVEVGEWRSGPVSRILMRAADL
jgi:hypothetical protein